MRVEYANKGTHYYTFPTRLPRGRVFLKACYVAPRRAVSRRASIRDLTSRALWRSRLSPSLAEASLTDRKNSCGGRAGCILKYSRAWHSTRRRSAKSTQDHPHLETAGIAIIYLYQDHGERTLTRATRKGMPYDRT